jgi:transcription initiation factor TFIID subunit 15
VHAGGGGLAQASDTTTWGLGAGAALVLGGLGAGAYMVRRRRASGTSAA